MNFELAIWPDGEVHLAHWDSVHGDDIDIVLGAESVERNHYDHEGDSRKERLDDLATFLRELAKIKGG